VNLGLTINFGGLWIVWKKLLYYRGVKRRGFDDFGDQVDSFDYGIIGEIFVGRGGNKIE
jgi:hypothetical protein